MDAGATTPTLTGGQVLLRAFRPDDVDERARHGFHAEIERGYGHLTVTRGMTRQEAQEWFAQSLRPAPDLLWVIETDAGMAGFADLHRVDLTNRRAVFAIGMVAPSFIGRGLGSQATELVLGHAFTTMRLHRVDLRVLAFNEPAIRCYRACGFVEEGRERDSCLLDGAWHDDLMMSILEQEYRDRHLAVVDR